MCLFSKGSVQRLQGSTQKSPLDTAVGRGSVCAHGSVPCNNFHMCLKVGAGAGEGVLRVVGRRKRRKEKEKEEEEEEEVVVKEGRDCK